MSEPFLGQITCMANNYPPNGWLQCRGQLLPVGQYATLFSLLGVQFGGNGTTSFALPNLQGSLPIGQGVGPGLTPRSMGGTGGEMAVQLTSTTVPAHNHQFLVSNAHAASQTPAVPPAAPSVLAALVQPGGHSGTPVNGFAPTAGNPSVALNAAALPPYAGGGQAHNNMQPSLALNWCIAIQGTYPERP